MSMMNSIAGVAESVASYDAARASQKTKTENQSKAQNTGKTQNTERADQDGVVTGKTIGDPKLSKKAAEYYEKLKKKYSNMDFILVSEDKKEMAKAQAGSYANANKMVVLVDEDKIERMAEDENYRKQYEAIIGNAASGMASLKTSLASTGASVKGYGMQVNDNGTASYFAVLDQSGAAQKERIEKKSQEKKEAKRTAKKKAEQKAQEERLEEKRTENKNRSDKYQKTDQTGKTNTTGKTDSTDKADSTVTITASSVEELMKKINDYMQLSLSDVVQTKEEKTLGQNVDFAI